MEKRYFSCGVFIDLKKAFDTDNHEILLDKLNFHGFQGLINDWFQSYLKNRTQTIQTREHLTTKLISSCYVPQRSVLGPLQCLPSINDIHLSSDKLKVSSLRMILIYFMLIRILRRSNKRLM